MLNFPYTNQQLTEQINRHPNLFGLMNALNLFPAIGVASRVVEIRFEDGQLVVLASDEVGAPGQTTERETGDTIYVGLPHFPHLDNVLARDLQDFNDVIGGVKVPKAFATEVAKRLKTIRDHHAITREYLRLGALRGLVKDGKGKTVLNLFDAFDIDEKKIDFGLKVDTTDVHSKFDDLVDYMAGAMRGETMTGVEIVCGRGWFSKFVQHPKVEKFWLNTQLAGQLANLERNRLGGQWGRVFEFQTVMVREYTGTLPVRGVDGKPAPVKNMGDFEARAYPLGTSNTFATYDGPANHMAKVNQAGEEVFISAELMKHGAGVEFASQSNSLPICKRPEFLVDCSTAA